MKYLKEFIIGSSFPIFFLFFVSTYEAIQKKKQTDPELLEYLKKKPPLNPFWNQISNYSYYTYYSYTLYTPFYFGITNIISLISANHFKLSKRMRFVVISILASIFTITIVTVNNVYKWKTTKEQLQYYVKIFISYMFVWNILVYNIDKYI